MHSYHRYACYKYTKQLYIIHMISIYIYIYTYLYMYVYCISYIYVIFSHVYGKNVLMYTVTPNGIIP